MEQERKGETLMWYSPIFVPLIRTKNDAIFVWTERIELSIFSETNRFESIRRQMNRL